MKICKEYEIKCDSCLRLFGELDHKIEMDCNDTGYTNDSYEIHFCDINCIKNYYNKKLYDYSGKELEEQSDFYKVEEFLNWINEQSKFHELKELYEKKAKVISDCDEFGPDIETEFELERLEQQIQEVKDRKIQEVKNGKD